MALMMFPWEDGVVPVYRQSARRLTNAEAFDLAHRFTERTARQLVITMQHGYCSISNRDPDIGVLHQGWNDGEPHIDAHGQCFAAAWESFRGYWSEAR